MLLRRLMTWLQLIMTVRIVSGLEQQQSANTFFTHIAPIRATQTYSLTAEATHLFAATQTHPLVAPQTQHIAQHHTIALTQPHTTAITHVTELAQISTISSNKTSASTSTSTSNPTSDLTSAPTSDPINNPISIPTSNPTSTSTSAYTSAYTSSPTSALTSNPTSNLTSIPTSTSTSIFTSNLTSKPSSNLSSGLTNPSLHVLEEQILSNLIMPILADNRRAWREMKRREKRSAVQGEEQEGEEKEEEEEEEEELDRGRVKRQIAGVGGITQFLMQLLNVPEELHMLAPGMIRRYNYPLEEHFVTTPDGYILGVHRIPGPRNSSLDTLPSFNPRVAVLVHCAACASSDYVLNRPDNSLGYLLADAGYDVWMGNLRGNTYSRNHTSLDPDEDPEFWHFSLDEIALYDIPTTVNYVRRHTRVDKIYYVGHSLGTLAFYMSASTPNSIVDKVRLMVSLAPSAFRDNVNGPLAIGMQLASIFRNLLEQGMTHGEMMSRVPLLYTVLYFLCNRHSLFGDTCVTIFTAIAGGVNKGFFEQEKLPYILAHLPSGISVRAFGHIGQLVTSNGMRKFNYGSQTNMRKYGSPNPPYYPIAAVTCPVALYWTMNDKLSSPKDVVRLASMLPHVVLNHLVPVRTFNHMDFLIADTARELVYDNILQLMERF